MGLKAGQAGLGLDAVLEGWPGCVRGRAARWMMASGMVGPCEGFMMASGEDGGRVLDRISSQSD